MDNVDYIEKVRKCEVDIVDVLTFIENQKIDSEDGTKYIPIEYNAYLAFYHYVMIGLADNNGKVNEDLCKILMYLDAVSVTSFDLGDKSPEFYELQYHSCRDEIVPYFIAKAKGRIKKPAPIDVPLSVLLEENN